MNDSVIPASPVIPAKAGIHPAGTLDSRLRGNDGKCQRFLLYGSERYALAILRPVQAAIRARGGETAWFFDGPGASDLVEGERLLDVEGVRRWNPEAVLTPGNHLPHFFPGAKVEVFHGFDAGKPRM